MSVEREQPQPEGIDRAGVWKTGLRLIRQKYIDPEGAERIVSDLQEKILSDTYAGADDAEFAEAVSRDLQASSGDPHLRLVFDPERIAKMRSRSSGGAPAEAAKLSNNGFARVEILKGGVAYVDIRHFFSPAIAAETAAAAMRFVADSDTVIVDLRSNTGGNPRMVQLICSYFFAPSPPVHLNTIVSRFEETSTEYWTLSELPGPRMPDAKLYILTSGHTFSGGEEFAYNMANLKRATLIGEATAGGANLAGIDILNDAFYLAVPHATPTNPITKTNWEGCGVRPHIQTDAKLALETAHRIGLEERIRRAPNQPARTGLEWLLEEAMSSYHPMPLPLAELDSYAGTYGDTRITRDGETLLCRRKFFTIRLVPLGEATFWLDGPAAGFESRIRFVLDRNGRASEIESLLADGRVLRRPRSA